MYLPEAFRLEDREALLAHASAHPFATVVTCRHAASDTAEDEAAAISHLPLLVDSQRGVLRGHLARDNPQLAHIAAGAHAVAVFHGPHAYVSPSVYAEPTTAVPTWNYVVVHAAGRARLVEEAALRQILDDMVTRFDATGWRLQGGEEALRPRLDVIAGFEIPLERVEGKWKISQNRPIEDQERVAAWLETSPDYESRALAALMRARF
jgi:transcriptional regulator